MIAEAATKTDSRLAARCAATASLGAAVIHFAVAPMHWRDWLPSGVFFVSIAVFQMIWAFFAWSRPTTLVLAAGIAGNAVSAALWVVSRTAGAPFGPYAGQPEAVEPAGICVLLLQCYVVMGAGWVWYRGRRTEQVSGLGRSLVLLGAHAVTIAAVTVGLASSLQGPHHDHGGTTEAESTHQVTPHAHMDHHPAAPGLPVTEMRLDTGGDHHDDPPEADAGHHHDE